MESPQTSSVNYSQVLRQKWIGMFRQVFNYILANKNVPWRQNWKTPAPINYYTKRPYNGFNVAMIRMLGNGDFAWATRKGIEANQHVLDMSEEAQELNPAITVGFVEFPSRTEQEQAERARYENPDAPKLGPRRMTYEVFPASRILNPLTGQKVIDEDDNAQLETNNKTTPIDSFYKAGNFKFKSGTKPLYNRLTDTIHMPPAKNFESDHAFHGTKAHECGHAVLHPTRYGEQESIDLKLKRDAGEYGREELTAEMFAMMVRQECGIQEPRVIEDSLTYVNGWYKSLAKDPEILLWACGEAQKRFDWVSERIAS